MESPLEKLYTENSHNLYRFAVGLVGDLDEANDIVQNIFARLVEQPDSKLITITKSYLYVAVRNGAKDFWKKKRPVPMSYLKQKNEEGEDDDFMITDNSPNPEEQVQTAFALEAILKALELLTTEQREVLTAKYFSGLTTSETASLVAKTENAVRQTEFRALRSLHKLLKQ